MLNLHLLPLYDPITLLSHIRNVIACRGILVSWRRCERNSLHHLRSENEPNKNYARNENLIYITHVVRAYLRYFGASGRV